MFKPTITLILVLGLLSLSSSLLTRKMLKAKMNRCALGQQCSEDIQINDAPKDVPILETSCSAVSLTAKYNYSGTNSGDCRYCPQWILESEQRQ